jgi:hypothetical protein
MVNLYHKTLKIKAYLMIKGKFTETKVETTEKNRGGTKIPPLSAN